MDVIVPSGRVGRQLVELLVDMHTHRLWEILRTAPAWISGEIPGAGERAGKAALITAVVGMLVGTPAGVTE